MKIEIVYLASSCSISTFPGSKVDCSHSCRCQPSNTLLLTEPPTFIVKLISEVFLVTVFITVWVTLWFATFCLVNVVQVGWRTGAEPHALHVITGRTQYPDISSGMEKKYLTVLFIINAFFFLYP